MIYAIQFLFFVPFATTISGGGWAEQYFAVVRKSSIANAGIISSIAISLACVFIAFKLIRMYYDLVSDEQSGGFGGVRMWDILRPLTILLLILTFGTWLGWLDGICNSISSALTSNMNTIAAESDKKLEEKLEDFQEKINEENKQAWFNTIASTKLSNQEAQDYILSQGVKPKTNGDYSLNENGDLVESWWSWGRRKSRTFTLNDIAQDNVEDNTKTLVESLKKTEEAKKANDDIAELSKKLKQFFGWFQKGSSWFGKLFTWLFNIFFVVMMAFADLMLCLLAIFGPIAAAFSILEPWKQSFTSWLGHYIEVSLWKPVGAAVCWVVSIVKASVGNLALSSVMDMSNTEGSATILGMIGAQCLILFAGIMAITQVPSITNTILSLGSMSDQFTNTAANATDQAMRAPLSGAKSIGSKIKLSGGSKAKGGATK